MTAVDDNGYKVLYGVSHRDGMTRVQVKFDANGKMQVDSATAIEFDPSISVSMTDNDRPLATATSSTDDATIMPWVVNEDTGAVLVQLA
jgi:hypothetical protein